MALRAEIFEQPAVLDRLLQTRRQAALAMAETIRTRRIQWVVIAARGSSDNAALYGKYLWGSLGRLPVALAAPSLFTLYRRPPRMQGALVVGISQSGESPDIVSVIEEGGRQGALTLAITNEPSSPLASSADLVLDTAVGPERAVAATKTYTAQLVAQALLCAAIEQDERLLAELAAVPKLVQEALALDETLRAAAGKYRAMEECVVLGRGFNYATACEWSLKLKEMARVVAEPYSSADFRHGPVTLVSEGFPVLAVVPGGAVFDDLVALLETLVAEQHARVLVLSNEQRALDLAEMPVRLSSDLPEWLSPVVGVVPAQLFCYHLATAKGLDPEAPGGLHKVTRTW